MFVIDEDNFVSVYKSGVYQEFKAMNFGDFFLEIVA
jgi:hypothetical protein